MDFLDRLSSLWTIDKHKHVYRQEAQNILIKNLSSNFMKMVMEYMERSERENSLHQ